jgi:transcriptional regulator with XRE-family HTH domain
MRKRDLNPVDKHVGSRARMRRLVLDMSQTEVAEGLGLTFQQIQKYEKGRDRVGASRLQHLSQVLRVPVAFFFEGLPVTPEEPATTAESLSYVNQFLATSDGLALANRSVAFEPRSCATRSSCLLSRSRPRHLKRSREDRSIPCPGAAAGPNVELGGSIAGEGPNA